MSPLQLCEVHATQGKSAMLVVELNKSAPAMALLSFCPSHSLSREYKPKHKKYVLPSSRGDLFAARLTVRPWNRQRDREDREERGERRVESDVEWVK